jgi:post-segregation antitoxin (ccd killing protein)
MGINRYTAIYISMARPKENLPPFERTSITLPTGTLERAKKVGINVSATASMAVIKAVQLLEGK